MQAGKVAQKILNSMGLNQHNQSNCGGMNQSDFSQQNNNQSRNIPGNLPNMNNSANNTSFNRQMGNINNVNNLNAMKGGPNVMSAVQSLAMQKLNEGCGGNMNSSGKSVFGGFNNTASGNNGDGLLGCYQGPGKDF